VQPVDDGHDDESRDAVGRTAQFATVYVDAYRVPALVAPVTASWVDIAVVLGGTATVARTRDVLRELVDRASAAFGIDLRAAMGTVVADARSVPASRRDAVATLETLAGATGNATAAYDEAHSRIALREIARTVRGSEHLTRGRVPALARSDAAADRLLVDTVRAYLDANGDVGRVAAELEVHRNTVRNRILRFEGTCGVDLSDATDRLVVALQLIR
jgi:DNA-binding PucR family transcriptional regulator